MQKSVGKWKFNESAMPEMITLRRRLPAAEMNDRRAVVAVVCSRVGLPAADVNHDGRRFRFALRRWASISDERSVKNRPIVNHWRVIDDRTVIDHSRVVNDGGNVTDGIGRRRKHIVLCSGGGQREGKQKQ